MKTATKKKTRSKPAKATKAATGRPTKYTTAHDEQARKLALLGMTDKEMADFFEVEVRTVYRWKVLHDSFRHALKAGKEGADTDVAASLYQAAIGGGTVTETREEPDAEGNIIVKKTVKQLPANVTAQIFFLKNRRPRDWRDKVVVEDVTPPEAIAETALRYHEIMAKARERQRQILIERGLLPPDGEVSDA